MKRFIFYTTLLILPLLILISVESLLRVSGFGTSYPLLIRKGNFYYLNTEYPKKFFSQSDIAVPELVPQKIPVAKAPNTVRILCLGGSTTAGFPFEVNINFPRFLQCYLKRALPFKQWEVINLGISAINSHTVRNMAPELLKLNPDIILIYMGHNEFYGALGLASNSFLGSNPEMVQWMLKLRELRLYQVLEKFIGLFSKKAEKPSSTLMEAMIKKNTILPGSSIYRKTMNNFRTNLSEILNTFNKNDIPVLLSTLTSNLKDQEPLGYTDPETSFPDYKKVRQLINKKQYRQALTILSTLLQSDSTNSFAHFLSGQIYYELQDYEAAKSHFVLARDYDLIPFRAPSEINTIICDLARLNNVFLVRSDSLFDLRSPHSITDNTLFLEHLHPNEKGYQLLAQGFFESMVRSHFIDTTKFVKPERSCQNYTNLDIAIGELKIEDLLKHAPFNGRTRFTPRRFEPPIIHRIAFKHVFGGLLWDAAHFEVGDSLLKMGLSEPALNEFLAVYDYDHTHPTALYKIGDVYLKTKQFTKAAYFYQQAVKANPKAAFLKAKFARALIVSGNVQSAVDVINKVINNPEQKRQLNKRQLSELDYLMAVALVQKGEKKQAIRFLDKVLRVYPNHRRALSLKMQIK
ncbi:MAG: tetratricopeptide repeat protein [Calditrichaeota bacterium]|nr:tetratricopeptide repeat protein [Calditrichota bacterium]